MEVNDCHSMADMTLKLLWRRPPCHNFKRWRCIIGIRRNYGNIIRTVVWTRPHKESSLTPLFASLQSKARYSTDIGWRHVSFWARWLYMKLLVSWKFAPNVDVHWSPTKTLLARKLLGSMFFVCARVHPQNSNSLLCPSKMRNNEVTQVTGVKAASCRVPKNTCIATFFA